MRPDSKPIQQMSTLEMLEYCEKKPITLYREATSRGLEVAEYLDRATKNDGVGSRNLRPFFKNLQKHNLPIKAVNGRKPALVSDFLLSEDHSTAAISFRRMLWHETMRLSVEDTCNAYKSDPIDVSPLTNTMNPNLQKLTGGFNITELVRDNMLRPAQRRPNQEKEHPRLVIELSDLTMGQVEIGFGGEKALVINNAKGTDDDGLPTQRFSTPRFAEYEEISRARLGTEEISHQIYKYGIGIEASYEFLQQMGQIGFDQIQYYFSQLATYWRMDEINEGLDTMLYIFNDATIAAAPFDGNNPIYGAEAREYNSRSGTNASDDHGLALTEVGYDPAGGHYVDYSVANVLDRRSSNYKGHLGSKEKDGGTNHYLDLYAWRNMFKNFPGYAPGYIRLNRLLANAQMTTEIELLNLEKTNIPLDRNVGPPVTRANPMPAMRTRTVCRMGGRNVSPITGFWSTTKTGRSCITHGWCLTSQRQSGSS